jgi:hypothetical protein
MQGEVTAQAWIFITIYMSDFKMHSAIPTLAETHQSKTHFSFQGKLIFYEKRKVKSDV